MKNLQPSPHKADPPKFLPKEHRAQLTVYQSSNDPPADPIYHPTLVGPDFFHKTGGVL